MERNFKEIDATTLKQWLDQGKDITVVDVLSAKSYTAQHVPGAISAPVRQADFLEQVAKHTDNKSASTVVYCASKACQLSPAAAQKLVDAGYTKVYDFVDGLAGWEQAGYPFESEEE